MAQRTWRQLSGGRLKCRKASKSGRVWGGTPPRWFRNVFNRRERRRARSALRNGIAERAPYVHPSSASWYW
jgi:hypothetical protein